MHRTTVVETPLKNEYIEKYVRRRITPGPMKDLSHKIFLLFLFLIGATAVLSLSVRGCDYYLTPLEKRAFRSDYADMKPSGDHSHGLGIIGTLMIMTGVTTYSTRKRVRKLWNIGRLSYWLEFHIFLCLLGPILIVYHTTFKAGGIASISLWTMLSVVSSGVIGRYLYNQIPRNMKGANLTYEEIAREIDELAARLRQHPLGEKLVTVIDEAFAAVGKPRTLSESIAALIQVQRIKSRTRKTIQSVIAHSHSSADLAKQLFDAASDRASLFQKSLVLVQVERGFYYWHAIHFPFSLIMFLTLTAHVVVAILLGYTWIF
jgi:hypothetical protein